MTRALATSIVLPCVLFGCGSQRATPKDLFGWSIYRNAKYGYEIGYPDGYELLVTGRVGERDGRRVRIGRKEYAAPTPILDVELNPTSSLYQTTAGKEMKDLRVEVIDIELSGKPARQVEFRWKTTDELAFVEIHREGVLLRFDAAPGLQEFEGTIWWKIVSTFRFYDSR